MSGNALAIDDGRTELDRIRLRLVDAASDLRPLQSPAELRARLDDVSRELTSIVNEIRVLTAVMELEDDGVIEEADELLAKLASGWNPPANDADVVIGRLAARYG